jgi:predicted RNase H-like HicB family nuclease
MTQFTGTVEKAEDGSWTAACEIGDHLILGDGDTREEALEDLRKGLTGTIEYLKSKGESLPQSSIEVVTIEVAF